MSTKTIRARYFPSSNTVKIKALSTEFVPGYLKYLFEYLKIPQDAIIVFKDRTVKGGVIELLQE